MSIKPLDVLHGALNPVTTLLSSRRTKLCALPPCCGVVLTLMWHWPPRAASPACACTSSGAAASAPADPAEARHGKIRRKVEAIVAVLKDERASTRATLRAAAAVRVNAMDKAAKGHLVGAGALPPLVRLCGSPDAKIAEAAARCLWNMAMSTRESLSFGRLAGGPQDAPALRPRPARIGGISKAYPDGALQACNEVRPHELG